MAGRDNRVLVVLICETRGWELTAGSLTSNVLDELGADLALCVGDHESPNPLYERAQYVWRAAEPDDWCDAYDRRAGNSRWRVLLGLGGNVIGGVDESVAGGSGIILYYRDFLRESLDRAGLTEAYDWIIVTRSDFIWPVPHPDVRFLSNRHLYVFDGEHYGGLTDRHTIVPRRFVKRYLSIPDPLFNDPEALRRRADQRIAAHGPALANTEWFIATRLEDLGLLRRVRYLPYVPFTVRPPGGQSRWGQGEFDEEGGYFVKYPSERMRSEIVQRFIRDQRSWKRYLSPVRGARMRRKLSKVYPQQEDHGHAFPCDHGVHHRASRWARSTLGRVESPAPRIGRQLRRVPGMSPFLDARVRRMRRRAARRAEPG